MARPSKRRLILILTLIPIAALLLFASFKGIEYWWYRGYSAGTRTGTIRKVSVKGPPFCKYLAGEMVTQGAVPGQPLDVWEFSVDDPNEGNPVVVALQDAEKKGARVTVHYRQDLHSMFRCTPSEYFITKVEP